MSEENNDYQDSINDAINKAKKEGRIVIESTDKTLLLDIDSGVDFDKCKVMLKIAFELQFISAAKFRPSKKKGFHVIVDTIHPMTPHERIAWQLALCSDRLREMLALNYIANKVTPFSFLSTTGSEFTEIVFHDPPLNGLPSGFQRARPRTKVFEL